ncbi:MAG: CHAP domain-containing protein [Armatimonadota bacterium]
MKQTAEAVQITSAAIELFLHVARTQLKVVEIPKGSNAGPEINRFLKLCGLGPGYYWCSAFGMWVGVQAADATAGDYFESWPLPRSADCDTVLFKARKLDIIHSTPQKGDIFFVMASPTDATHLGIVEAVNKDGTIRTIEGNSNDGGSRNGYKVANRPSRSVKHLQFARWIDTVQIPTLPWRILLVPSDGSPERPICTAFMQDGQAYAPTRHFLKMVGMDDSTLKWNDDTQSTDLFGKPMPVQSVRLGPGDSWGWIRQLVTFANLAMVVDGSTRLIRVFRPK